AFIGLMAQPPGAGRSDKGSPKAGIAAAQQPDDACWGRKPAFTSEAIEAVLAELEMGSGATEPARIAGVSRQTVYRIKADPAVARVARAPWGLSPHPSVPSDYGSGRAGIAMSHGQLVSHMAIRRGMRFSCCSGRRSRTGVDGIEPV